MAHIRYYCLMLFVCCVGFTGCGNISSENRNKSLLQRVEALEQEHARLKPVEATVQNGGFVHGWDCKDSTNPFTKYEACEPSDFQTLHVESGRFTRRSVMRNAVLNEDRTYHFHQRTTIGGTDLIMPTIYLEILVVREGDSNPVINVLQTSDTNSITPTKELTDKIALLDP
jgi:hypothetical protein